MSKNNPESIESVTVTGDGSLNNAGKLLRRFRNRQKLTISMLEEQIPIMHAVHNWESGALIPIEYLSSLKRALNLSKEDFKALCDARFPSVMYIDKELQHVPEFEQTRKLLKFFMERAGVTKEQLSVEAMLTVEKIQGWLDGPSPSDDNAVCKSHVIATQYIPDIARVLKLSDEEKDLFSGIVCKRHDLPRFTHDNGNANFAGSIVRNAGSSLISGR